MNVKLTIISESDYLESNSKEIFKSDNDKFYGIIENKNCNFKFGWQSDIVKPKINELSENIYSVGIDLNFAIIDFKKDNVILNLSLDYFFYETKLHNGFIYVITELLIIKINQMTYEIIEKFGLPDIFEEIIFKENTIEIICLNNEIVYYPALQRVP